MKRFVLILIICCPLLKVGAQLPTKEQPFGFSLNDARSSISSITLSSSELPDMNAVEAEDLQNNRESGVVRVAVPVQVNYTLHNSGSWKELPDGGRLWQLEVVLPGALSTSVIYDQFRLPEGARFWVYNRTTKQYIGAVTSEQIKESTENPGEYATGLIFGDRAVFEYYQPASVKDAPVISISRIVYGYRNIVNPYEPESTRVSGTCQVNVNCSPEGDNWKKEKTAVVYIYIMGTVGDIYHATGALVNNTRQDGKPYVLTANHVLSDVGLFDAISTPTLTRWWFYFNFEWENCAGTQPSWFDEIKGARVVANNSSSDFALLELDVDPRTLSGITPYYLGWDRRSGIFRSRRSDDSSSSSRHEENRHIFNNSCFGRISVNVNKSVGKLLEGKLGSNH